MSTNSLGIVCSPMCGNQKMVNSSKKYIISKVVSLDTNNFVMNPLDLVNHFHDMISFNLKRVYWINRIKGLSQTGSHAHTDENGIFLIINGSCKITLDDGSGMEVIDLVKNNIVFVPKYVWHSISDMSKDFILLVLSDKNYDHNRVGYIEDHDAFKKLNKTNL